ncbi:hypothetical protein T458_06395 [Brevibacillus panacihumi W25]|uniref:Glycosyltransferase 2-like domain-containing protein n=1 Tax=Brevibacillus panacihumi W25 TaxID=1408254 RepID=V6MAT4_9BACL|nr:glycosyltransferase [Brevibacillus panacihumi]EST55666.1 hypothetical protein T458_06395 [Brevibacillus panacihumi W25]
MDKKIKLSICMIVKDEEKNLERCLSSLQLLNQRHDVELIIVDTGSTDKTIEIAQAYTENVFYHEWNGNFSDMRNISISYAKGEWLFIIDADEELQDPEKLSLLMDKKSLSDFNTVVIRVKNFVSSDQNIFIINKSERLFRNDGFCYQGSVHNQPRFKMPILFVTDIFLKHYGYNSEDKELMEKKFQRTSKLLLEELKKNPENIYYHFQLSRTYSMHGDYKEAYKEAKQAYELLSGNEINKKIQYLYVYHEYVRMSILLGRYEEAKKACTEGLEINPNYIDLQYYMGVIYEECGDKQSAFEARLIYLKLHKKFTEDRFDDKGLIELYKLDDNSKYEILFKVAHFYYDNKNFTKAEEFLKPVIDNEPKILLYTKILLDGKQFTGLREYYDSLTEGDKDKLVNLLEVHRKELDEQEKYELARAFIEGEGCYHQLNKIRTTPDEKVLFEAKSFLAEHDINNLPLFYAEVFSRIMEYPIFWQELKKLKSAIVRKVIKELVLLNHNHKVSLETLVSKMKIRHDDYQGNRIFICIIYVLLVMDLEKHGKENIEMEPELLRLFDKYLEYGIQYIKCFYQMDKFRLIYTTVENSEEQFFMLMYLYNQAMTSRNFKVALNYMREIVSVYPVMSPFLKNTANNLNGDII